MIECACVMSVCMRAHCMCMSVHTCESDDVCCMNTHDLPDDGHAHHHASHSMIMCMLMSTFVFVLNFLHGHIPFNHVHVLDHVHIQYYQVHVHADHVYAHKSGQCEHQSLAN